MRDELPQAREAANQVYGEPMIQAYIKVKQLEDLDRWGPVAFSELSEKTETIGDHTYTSQREDMALLNQPAVALLKYDLFADHAARRYHSYKKHLEDYYHRDWIGEAESRREALLAQLKELDQEATNLQVTVQSTPPLFAKKAVKESHRGQVSLAHSRLQVIAQERAEVVAKLVKEDAHLAELRAGYPAFVEKTERYETFLATLPQTVTPRVRPWALF